MKEAFARVKSFSQPKYIEPEMLLHICTYVLERKYMYIKFQHTYKMASGGKSQSLVPSYPSYLRACHIHAQ